MSGIIQSVMDRIVTPSLYLMPVTLEHLRVERDHPEKLAEMLNLKVPASWPPGEYDHAAISFFCDQYEAEGPDAVGWYCWYGILPGTEGEADQLVATGGYFGRPTIDGTMEIGYSVVPEMRGRGFATEVAQALTKRALKLPEVRRVIAHTALDNFASHRVLSHVGFKSTGIILETGLRRFERYARKSDR